MIQWESREKNRSAAHVRRRTEDELDAGHGACHLRRPDVAAVVEGALLKFDAVRYRLFEWTIMPNHVHALIQVFPGCGLGKVVGSRKSFTATQANRVLGRHGRFWHPDYFDRYMRDERHFVRAVHYIRYNPVKAGLVSRPEDWPFGSAGSMRRSGHI